MAENDGGAALARGGEVPGATRSGIPPLDAGRTAAVLAVGAFAAAVIPDNVPGIGVAATGVLAGSVVVAGRVGGPPRDAWSVTALMVGAAAAVLPAVSDAGWVVAPALLVGAAIAALALAGGRTWSGLLRPLLRCLPDSARAGVAVAGGAVAAVPSGSRARPALRATLLTVGVVGVFGALFASADQLFGRLVDRFLIPDLDLDLWPVRAFVLVVVAVAVTTMLRLARRDDDDRARRPATVQLTGVEWQVPLVALLVLFVAFLAVQFGALFGGHDWVEAAAGLTYAEHARGGFAQLVVVALLTLLVIAASTRHAVARSPGEQRLLRGLLAGLCGLTLVVLASALYRLWLYQDAFGFTRARFGAQAVIWWLAVVFALVVVAGARRRSDWLPRAVVLVTAAGVVGVGFLRPDAIVAQANLDRFASEGQVDLAYLDTLSADAVPVLTELPAALQGCVLEGQAAWVLDDEDTAGWGAGNLSRARAATLLTELRARGMDCDRAAADRLDTDPSSAVR